MNKEINAINVMIVDDEQEAIDYLAILLHEYFPEINITATAKSSEEAVNLAFRKHPDLIFLDIKIDSKNGFDIIKELGSEGHKPHIIFVTAYDKYAIEAFKTDATDYLLKPVDAEDLTRAVNKFAGQREKELQYQNIENRLNNYRPKIRFNTRTGYILLNPDDIVYCRADGNYSEIYLKGQPKKVVTSNLRNLIKQLPQPPFQRISRYNIINKNYLTEVDRGNRECKLFFNGEEVVLRYSPQLFSELS